MNDSQWPRWEVFKKDSDKKPYQAVGSIHAADPDHALLNARNVFVRRPAAVGLWVVQANDIFSKTLEELEADFDAGDVDLNTAVTIYEMFIKTSHRRSMTFMDHVGQVEAPSPALAIQKAKTQFETQSVLAWWIIPSNSIVKSEPEHVDAWFEPAKTKTYKQQSQYGFVSSRRGKTRKSDE